MANFNGNNKSKPIKTAFDRSNFKLHAYDPDALQVVDFNFAERTFYGRVNRQLDPIIVNNESLRNFYNQDFRIMNFVGDQFHEMYVRYSNALDLSLINKQDANLSKLSVIRGWEDPIKGYSDFMSLFMGDFLEKKMLPNDRKIDSFPTFLKFFEAHVLETDIKQRS